MTLEEAIHDKLDAGVLLGKVFPKRAPELFATPYVVYKRQATSRMPNLTTQGIYMATFEFYIVSSGYGDAIAKRDLIRSLFEDVTGVYATGAPYIQATEILNEDDTFEEKTDEYGAIIEIQFTYNL